MVEVEVGGANFAATKQISPPHEQAASAKTNTANDDNDRTIVLVAKGKSHLLYFYISVCSSVLYLAPNANNDAVLFGGNDLTQNLNADDVFDDRGALTRQCSQEEMAMALEIYYHKPARAADFRWATRTYIEANLPDGAKIEDLPANLQREISQFNNLYKNVRIGDRYMLSYIPGIGVTLFLNEDRLGSVGTDLRESERRDLAKLVFSVWFGSLCPFSESMKRELLTPLEPAAGVFPAPLMPNDGGRSMPFPFVKDSTARSRDHTVIAANIEDDTTTSDTIQEEEKQLLDSLGIMQLIKDNSTNASSKQPEATNCSDTTLTSEKSHSANERLDLHGSPSSLNCTRYISRSQLEHSFFNPKIAPPLEPVDMKPSGAFGTEFSVTAAAALEDVSDSPYISHEGESTYNHILLGLGGTVFLLPHLAIILSLPPVLRRRGAPYLPTLQRRMDVMFDLVRNHLACSSRISRVHDATSLQFADLGSGDGRVVFRASRENMFSMSVGYEINPALHAFSCLRRAFTPRYWHDTRFQMRDLWNVRMCRYDVIAVYGLSPIMERLGRKLEKELRPGSLVVSNVFQIPGWRPCAKSSDGVYLYRVPNCFGGKERVEGT